MAFREEKKRFHMIRRVMSSCATHDAKCLWVKPRAHAPIVFAPRLIVAGPKDYDQLGDGGRGAAFLACRGAHGRGDLLVNPAGRRLVVRSGGGAGARRGERARVPSSSSSSSSFSSLLLCRCCANAVLLSFARRLAERHSLLPQRQERLG